MNERKTITISRKAFEKLKTWGTFGESYTDLVLRLMDKLDFGANNANNMYIIIVQGDGKDMDSKFDLVKSFS
jgi:hypothetical protein